MCFLEEGAELEYFYGAKNGSIAKKIFKKANQKDVCVLLRDGKIGNISERSPHKIFLLVYNTIIPILSKIIQSVYRINTFSSSDPTYESLRIFVMAKKIEKDKRNFINKW